MRPAHIDNQIRIARIAAYTLHYIGKLDACIYNLAKSAGISEGRLSAMVKFIQTKGEPNHKVRNFE